MMQGEGKEQGEGDEEAHEPLEIHGSDSSEDEEEEEGGKRGWGPTKSKKGRRAALLLPVCPLRPLLWHFCLAQRVLPPVCR